MCNAGFPLILIMSIAFFALFATPVSATDQMQTPASRDARKTGVSDPRLADEAWPQQWKSVRPPMYQPPQRGAPLVRVGGGTRGAGTNDPAVYVLVPAHTGLTTKAQPELFWYSSQPSTAKLEFTLIDDQSIDPILETSLGLIRSKGIQRIRISDFGIELSPGSEYQWSVAIVQDPEQRSRDVVSIGRIEYVAIAPALAGEMKAAAPEDLPYLYARNGFWYDALAALSALIDADPTDARLRDLRATLLEQVGLHNVAAAERQ